MNELGYDLSAVQDDILRFEEQGASVSVLAVDGIISALWAVEDELRPETIEVVKELQSQGIDVWMLTGDNRRTAQYIAKQAGITHVIAEVLPQDKASKVKELQDKGLVVGMVGDGINDVTCPCNCRYWLCHRQWYRYCSRGGGYRSCKKRFAYISSSGTPQS